MSDSTHQESSGTDVSFSSPPPPQRKRLWRELGPGLITAAVVVGPGTITVASKIGASVGMSLLWALLIAGSFMMLFTSMSARIGTLNRGSILTVVTRTYGRWLAVLIGIFAFAVCAGFQSSNYIACATALEGMTGVTDLYWVGIVGAAALIFVFGARQLYKALEKVMMALTGIMVLAFIVNLMISRPNPIELFGGLIPRGWDSSMNGLVIAMLATTFSVIAALYQSTLAQQKGWTNDDLDTGVKESMFGISVLVGITLMIMWTAATALPGRDIANAADLAEQLEPLLGGAAKFLFGAGFLAAGFSSTVVNAMIGGGLLADGLGLKADMNAAPARGFTALAMAVGLSVGFWLLNHDTPITAIVIAQQSTIVTVPLVALVLILLANHPKIVGEHRNRWWQNAWAGFALLVLLSASLYKLKELKGLFSSFSGS